MSQPMVPVIDDELILADYSVYMSNGLLPVQVPVLIGSTKDEANPTIESVLTTPIPSAYFGPVLAEFLGEERAASIISSGLFPIDDSVDDATRLALAHVATLFFWTCAIQTSAATLATTYSKDVFMYEMNVGITYPSYVDLSLCQGNYVCHESDLYPLFGTFNTSAVTSAQHALSAEVQQRWSSFIKNGSPNGSHKYQQWWPVSSAKSMNALVLGSESFQSTLFASQCAIMGNSVKFDYQLYSQS